MCGARLHDGVGGAHATRCAPRWWSTPPAPGPTGCAARRGAAPRLRPLRGSHLVLPAWRLPLAQAISLMHPADGRPVFAFPWEGVTLVGTTDVDHGGGMAQEAAITRAEVDYLMAALHGQFPRLALVEARHHRHLAGVRPVIDSGQGDPSQGGARPCGLGWRRPVHRHRRQADHLPRDRARRAEHAGPLLPGWAASSRPLPLFAAPPAWRRAPVKASQPAARALWRAHAGAAGRRAARRTRTIPGTETLWAELRWAARAEAVVHLEDLLLRRTRLGLLLRGGGAG